VDNQTDIHNIRGCDIYSFGFSILLFRRNLIKNFPRPILGTKRFFSRKFYHKLKIIKLFEYTLNRVYLWEVISIIPKTFFFSFFFFLAKYYFF